MFALLLVENNCGSTGQRSRDMGDKPLHPFRAGRARLDCVQLYTNAAFDSNVNSTPAVVPGIPTGDDCTKQCGRSHEEVNQLIPSRAETTSLICRLSASSRHGHSEIVGEPDCLVVIGDTLAIEWSAGRLPPRDSLRESDCTTV